MEVTGQAMVELLQVFKPQPHLTRAYIHQGSKDPHLPRYFPVGDLIPAGCLRRWNSDHRGVRTLKTAKSLPVRHTIRFRQQLAGMDPFLGLGK